MRRALIVVAVSACWRGASPETPTATPAPSQHEPAGEQRSAFVVIDTFEGDLADDATRRVVTDAISECARAVPIRGDIDFVAVSDGTIASSSARFADPIVNACIERGLGRVRVPASATARRGAQLRGVTLAAGPNGCTAVYKLGERARACVTSSSIDVVDLERGALRSFARRRVLDASGEAIVVEGPCDAKDDYNVENAVCIVAASPSVVYVSPKTASQPGFPRGVVRPEGGGIIATNGLVISRSEDSNKDTMPDGDVQAELSAAGIRPASCARWTVRSPLHRERARLVMTFEDCAHRPVDVELVLGDLGDYFHWRRVSSPERRG